ncbi:12105_t:CDS:1 [Cetraspora pellucida]|uniref:12105_t:CDS:1 n=1 Tax=Cetraspora pellucida TaxID=1433469 RepID=A0A9N8YU24_9GLOM|nr:12105_t:CDS:1 [Cetraspora pellucida]
MIKSRSTLNKRALTETTNNEHQLNNSQQINYINTPSVMMTPPLSQRATKRRRNRDTPPRPLNSFMIYRREFQKKIKEQNPNILLSELSRISKSAADQWANEPQTVKQIYAEKARFEKEQHMKLYPNYVYCPRRPTKTKPRKKSTSEGSSEKMSVRFLLNDDPTNSFRPYHHPHSFA